MSTMHGMGHTYLEGVISSNVWPRVDRIIVLLNAYSAFQNYVNPQNVQRYASTIKLTLKNAESSSVLTIICCSQPITC